MGLSMPVNNANMSNQMNAAPSIGLLSNVGGNLHLSSPSSQHLNLSTSSGSQFMKDESFLDDIFPDNRNNNG